MSDIRGEAKLNEVETVLVSSRNAESAEKRQFDFAHCKAIHYFLFSDSYDWTGQIRTVTIKKRGALLPYKRNRRSRRADRLHELACCESFLPLAQESKQSLTQESETLFAVIGCCMNLPG